MNILHISPYVPNESAYHAGGVMMWKEIEELKKQGHNVFVMSFINNKKEIDYASKYPQDKSCFVKSTVFSKLILAIFHLNMPLLFAIRNSFKFKKELIKNIEDWKIDAIHADYTSMGQYYWIKKYYPNIIFNVVEHDVVLQSYIRKNNSLFYAIQCKLVKKYEKKILLNCNDIFVVSKKDACLVEKYYGSFSNIHVLCPYYGDNSISNKKVAKINNSICFVGNMKRAENEEAAIRLINIFNKLKKSEQYKLYIIGSFPSKKLKSFSNNNVIITGFVDDIMSEIAKCEIAVFPLMHGAGVKFKVLQTMTLGLPTITTSVGAEGIDESGKALIIKENDDEIAKEIIDVLKNRKKFDFAVRNNYSLIRANFDWNKSEEIFRQIYVRKEKNDN